MAVPTRFELAVFSVTGRHVGPLHHGTNSSTLFYRPRVERVEGLVGMAGLEPVTP